LPGPAVATEITGTTARPRAPLPGRATRIAHNGDRTDTAPPTPSPGLVSLDVSPAVPADPARGGAQGTAGRCPPACRHPRPACRDTLGDCADRRWARRAAPGPHHSPRPARPRAAGRP